MMTSMAVNAAVAVSLLFASASAFTPAPKSGRTFATSTYSPSTRLNAMDPVTYLRTEWVSASLCTNQTPRSADRVLQLGSDDGRIVNFVPRTVREIITSSAEPENGGLTVACERQLKQMVRICERSAPADDLTDVKSSSIDVVVSLQAAERMDERGYDWKKSIKEAARVLKPGGRFLFVEPEQVGGESYLDYVRDVSDVVLKIRGASDEEITGEIKSESGTSDLDGDEESTAPLFEEVGYDQVDMVLQPHLAGVAIKALDADLTPEQKFQLAREEDSDRLAEMTLNAFERGSKSRRRRKKKRKREALKPNVMLT
ncbi:hypothetical protein THAOC_20159 [Thalassiosira oceanica]|uniref:Methyltransferase type 11 domain-containing protein n=1 Tax=Thalassiosira oceanica TaxID=159749 RepID=K0SMB7_THAOC|nr:hypothetical protein THAOC_20159 [Thalassiosira oceanica]|eukprot:EJK59592.1 hypothetical protein THAOC_20159 [Thalassiosira oceanica]